MFYLHLNTSAKGYADDLKQPVEVFGMVVFSAYWQFFVPLFMPNGRLYGSDALAYGKYICRRFNLFPT
jgi:hypothetical protein